MTQAQQKQRADELKQALGNINKPETSVKPNDPTESQLDDRYTYEGNIDDLLLARLKELNITDIKEIITDNLGDQANPNEPFQKEDRAPPPQYHLESSRGDVKTRVTPFDLKSHFGGRKLHDFSLLSKLGTGLTIVNDNSDLISVGELVNRKRGKRKQKGS